MTTKGRAVTTAARKPIATLPLPSLPDAVEIYEGTGRMSMAQTIATSETDDYGVEVLRTVAGNLKVWIKRKSDGEIIRTVAFDMQILLETLSNMALDSIKKENPS